MSESLTVDYIQSPKFQSKIDDFLPKGPIHVGKTVTDRIAGTVVVTTNALPHTHSYVSSR